MSGSFEDIHVPPTLVSFAVTTGRTSGVITSEFKKQGNTCVLLRPYTGSDGLPDADSLKAIFAKIKELNASGKIASVRTLGMGGLAEAAVKCAMGNGLGFDFDSALSPEEIFGRSYGSFIAELTGDASVSEAAGDKFECKEAGRVSAGGFSYRGEHVSSEEINAAYENKLEPVFSCNIADAKTPVYNISYSASERTAPAIKVARPKVLIPAFPGTNCEYDSARAMRDAGAEPEIIVIRNLSGDAIKESVERFSKELKTAQMIFIPGGFSGGDEPDGSGKFITAFFRNAAVKEGVTELLDERGGLMCGICNGFQALIKLGLVPYGRIIDTDENSPTLTFNTISRHQSKIVRTRIASNKSPWLSFTNVGEVYSVPISHGEGRFLASDELIKTLAENGQIATQYADLSGNATNVIQFNPNGSCCAVEGITSPDGRVFGKMGHSERTGKGLYKNVPGEYDIRMFEAAVKYFN